MQFLVVYQRRRGGRMPIAGTPSSPSSVEIAAVPRIFDCETPEQACELAAKVEGVAGDYFAVPGVGRYVDPADRQVRAGVAIAGQLEQGVRR